jgi:hypothetical protein
MRASLAVNAPKVLWRSQKFSGVQSGMPSDGGPVLASNRLAFHADDWVYFVDKDGGKPQVVKYNNYAAHPSALVADPDGNVYYSAPDGLYSLDANGGLRWSVSIDTTGTPEFAGGVPPVLSPDGVVYFATRDMVIGAFRTSDGKRLWSQPMPKAANPSSSILGGAGKAVFLYVDRRGIDVLDAATGETIGTLQVVVDGVLSRPGAQWGSWALGWDLGIALGTDFVFDTCGDLRWSHWSRNMVGGSGVIAAGELLVDCLSTYSDNSWTNTALRLIDTGGNVVRSTSTYEGVAVAAGADGTIYTLRCDDRGSSTNRILAYSYDLKELWRLDLGGNACKGMTGNVVLDDSGVMFLTRGGDSGANTEVIAIQTASPGLADSSWPSLRHDNRGTAWLVPGVAAGVPLDGGDAIDVSTAMDAP